MADRIELPIPKGELLPAEERLQNVLNAIEKRIHSERAIRDEFRESAPVEAEGFPGGYLSGFVAGLDLAWSLAKTESLSRGSFGAAVGSEVRTRSGAYPSIPYVKQEDGSWKPKYSD